MKQKQFSPLTIAEMAVSLFAAEKGYLDAIPLKKIVEFEHALLNHVRLHNTALLQRINRECELNTEIELGLKSVIEHFKETWAI